MRLKRITATALGVLLAASAALAQEVVVYPAKGQSADQMEKDKYECYQWAKGQSGFDPMAPPTPTSAPPPETDSGASVGGGLVKGAVLGSVIGGVTGGNWGHGAAYGAAAKGSTLLNYAGVRPDLIEFVADRNPAKQGKHMPGSRIPILSEAAIRTARPDHLIILPWNLTSEIVSQLGYVREWRGDFVTAVPSLRVQ